MNSEKDVGRKAPQILNLLEDAAEYPWVEDTIIWTPSWYTDDSIMKYAS